MRRPQAVSMSERHSMTGSDAVEDLLRELAPRVLGLLVRRHGQFEECEDAVQEALLAAAIQWPKDGIPDNPRGWLITIASRKLIDQIRGEHARKEREVVAALQEIEPAEPGDAAESDDTLTLLFLCCHPVLTPASQMALTLRAVGGLTTSEIARAFLVPDNTMGARISRAKQQIKSSGGRFDLPSASDFPARLSVVLHVLYLIFTEGHLGRAELAHEAIRLTRMVRGRLPDDPEVAGLLGLMLLTESRRAARSTPDGDLIPLDEQDRTRWNPDLIAEGLALAREALAGNVLGPYQIQAAIAGSHADAARAEDTNWRQVQVLYQILDRIAPNPMVTLNRAVAVAEVQGPQAGLELLSTLDGDERIANHHRFFAVRAHLREKADDRDGAREDYERAATLTTSLAERRYLKAQAYKVEERRCTSA